MLQKIIIAILLVNCALSFSQELGADVPEGYFSNPLEIDLKLSGNFGELRSNHFHSGLDIKTNQRTGLPVLATASGYVSRIKIERYGYGKALYITHPNGYTSVYAHLSKFSPRIEEYVKKRQYEKESYTIQLYPGDLELRVDKSEIVAYSGNSGGSGGPHLHFEIRDSASKPINPMLMGIQIADTKRPLVRQLKAYPLTENSVINGKHEPVLLRAIRQKNGTYKAEKLKAYGRIGIAVNTTDSQNGSNNKNGVYHIDCFLNGSPHYEITFDTYAFSESRYINQMIDYAHFKKHKSRLMKLYKPAGSPLSLYGEAIDNGMITLIEPGSSNLYRIEIKDFQENVSVIHVDIENDDPVEIPNEAELDESFEFIESNNTFTKKLNKFEVIIPKNSLYQNEIIEIREASDTLFLHKDEVPLHKNIIINYDLTTKEGDNLNQYYIGSVTPWGKVYYVNSRRKGNILTATTRYFSTFAVSKDTDSPTIVPLNFKNKQWISKHEFLKLKIDDKTTGIDGYRATVNGEFILMEYDYKTGIITHYLKDGVVKNGENNLKVIVTDDVGNSTTFESTFYRKT